LSIQVLIQVGSSFCVLKWFSTRTVCIRLVFENWKQLLHHGFFLWFEMIGKIGFNRLDKWFIGLHCLPDQLGFYTRAFNYSPLSSIALNSFLSNPTISALARKSCSKERISLMTKTTIITLTGGILNTFFWLLFADPVVVWVFGKHWAPSIPYFKAFAGYSFCYAFFALAMNYLLSIQDFMFVGITRIVGVAILAAFLIGMTTWNQITIIAYVMQVILFLQGLILWGRCFHLEFLKE